MTYSLHEEDSASFDGGVPVGALMTWAGALVSVVLMAGLTFWGWQLLMRDVTGVPVVRALEGPMRIAPEEPGGEVAVHQGLSVTHVGSEGAEEAPAERVVLAPPPVQLAEEDLPVAALIPDTPASAEIPAAEEQPRSAIEMAIAEALEQTSATAAPVAQPAVLTSADAARLIPVRAGGVMRSPRPPTRPSELAATLISAVISRPGASAGAEAGVDAGAGAEVDLASLEPGTRLVQLGAFASVEEARAAWSALDNRLGDYMTGKSRLVQEASAGGSTFYRLRATGFDDLSEARRFCALLVAEQANCVPVVLR